MFRFRQISILSLLAGVSLDLPAQIASVDGGTSAAAMAGWDEALLREWGATRPWVRVRARPDPGKTANGETVAKETAGLSRLRELGFKPIPFYRWGPQSWTDGVRSGGGQRLPLDLREAYRRAFAYGEAYGAAVAGFEIENEPDISFVQDNAETYMAFLKACFLGLKKGAISGKPKAESGAMLAASSQSLGARQILGRPADRWQTAGHQAARARLASSGKLLVASSPLVSMAPLALPPGPYLEQLVANGLFSYTDAFNYHYYGYAEDFKDVYWQFETAVKEIGDWRPKIGDGVGCPLGEQGSDRRWEIADGDGAERRRWQIAERIAPKRGAGVTQWGALRANKEQLGNRSLEMKDEAGNVGRGFRTPPVTEVAGDRDPALQMKMKHSVKRTLPVLLTEYGYGSLGDPERNTVEGRVRQWRWFKSVGEQILDLRIAGPMAFYLPPYFENKSMEFGVSVRAAHDPVDGDPASHEATQGEAVRSQTVDSGADAAGTEQKAVSPDGSDVGRGLRTPPDRGMAGSDDPALQFRSGNQSYRPSDFGLNQAEPWMEQIGRRFGENEATSALAWLFDYGQRHPYKSKDWTVHAPEASPVVIDFIAGEGLIQTKRFGGYLATKVPNSSDKQKVINPPSPGFRRGKQDEVVGRGLRTPPSSEKAGVGDPPPPTGKAGAGQLVIYNFSDQPISGKLIVTEGRELLTDPEELESERTLEPMGRVVVPVTLRVPAQEFVKQGLTVRFAPRSPKIADGRSEIEKRGADGQRRSAEISVPFSSFQTPNSHLPTPKTTVSLFSTSFYPEATWMREVMLHDFTARSSDHPSVVGRGLRTPPISNQAGNGLPSVGHAKAGGPALQPESGSRLPAPSSRHVAAAAANVALLETRPLATEEPRLEATPGRWRTTRGLEVTETTDGSWRFVVKQFPLEPHKPAMAELPLPDDFTFPDGGMLRMVYRLVDPPGADIKTGKYFELYFRTANGNLYQVWPRQYAMANWQEYTEVKENFTMAFYGRANLPWRFKDNRPVALVFFFRPGTVPATYEIRDARIVKLEAGNAERGAGSQSSQGK